MPIARRRLLATALGCFASHPLLSAFAQTPALELAAAAQGPVAQLKALERKHGGRLGVAILDTRSGRRINHRAEQRFALLSTFKLLAAALVLARVDRGEERLDRRVVFQRRDLITWSPVTESRTGAPGMTLAELARAAIDHSDNTAGNLLLESFGGPAALTAFARTLGDRATRLDRNEPTLNDVPPGELRDTTTPAAMLASMRALLVGDALSASSRKQLIAWLEGNTTGDARLRAGLPRSWRVGDKTGTNGNASNDVAIVWPADRSEPATPILVAAYYDNATLDSGKRDAVLAEVGRIVAGIAMPAPTTGARRR